MGRIYSLKEAQDAPHGQIKAWLYNALDTTGTREIADTLLERMTPAREHVYTYERALQGPALSMSLKGVRIDVNKRTEMVLALKRELAKEERLISKMEGVVDKWDGVELETGYCKAEPTKRHKWPRGVPDGTERKCERCGISRVKPKPFEPNSPAQTMRLFYKLHGIPEMYNKKGEVSTDKETLARMGNKYPQVAHITDAILKVHNLEKQLGSLNAKLSPDNRYHSSFNVGAAWTGRFSSSKSPYMQGGNLQNWAERHRACALPDHGYDIAYADLKQAESNLVAHIADDQAYIDAHKSGDVHTFVTRLVWPQLPWTGDLKKDKAIAKMNPEWDQAPGHDFRFQAKRIQHGSNYGLTPHGIAMIARIPLIEAKRAQTNYFYSFPGIKAWQESIGRKVKEHAPLVNPLGREIQLMGRPGDPHTYKQALAFIPQSAVADILDLAMWRVWKEQDPHELQLLAQVHDALLLQYLSGRIDIIKKTAHLMRIPVRIGKRILIIEPEVAVGKNWGKRGPDNPYGIEEIEV